MTSEPVVILNVGGVPVIGVPIGPRVDALLADAFAEIDPRLAQLWADGEDVEDRDRDGR